MMSLPWHDHPFCKWVRLLILEICILYLVAACGDRSTPAKPREDGVATSSETGVFIDQTETAGLSFVHFNGMSGDLFFIEPVGPGGALFDYDNDGDLDAYLIQGTMLPADRPLSEASTPPMMDLPLRDRLFRNDLTIRPDGTRTLSFTDVTEESAIDSRGYGMGAAAGDFDNDGWIDLYVTNFGPNELWRNNADGTFSQVTSAAGAGRDGWSTSSSWLDYDRDGLLDLFVTQYVDYRLEGHKTCRSRSGHPDYCGPQSYDGLPDLLLRNRGDGTFEDQTGPSGLLSDASSGLGVLAADFDSDDWIDIYVANDLRRNFLWMNRTDGRFEDQALIAGVAVSAEGKAEASMGVVAADIDNDGDEDIFLTHLRDGTNTLYRNQGLGLFEDRSRVAGLDMPSLSFTGFGTALLDYDNDGWLDVVAANGSVFRLEELILAGNPYPLGQRNQLFRNLGDGSFEDTSAEAGSAFARLEVSRGLAVGDVDNDGDTDVLLMNNHGPARLLMNQVGHQQPWIGLRLLTESGRDALGARAEIVRQAGPDLYRRAHSDGSYCSSNDPRVLVGLAEDSVIEAIRVSWPDGRHEDFGKLEPGRYHSLIAGTGQPIEGER